MAIINISLTEAQNGNNEEIVIVLAKKYEPV